MVLSLRHILALGLVLSWLVLPCRAFLGLGVGDHRVFFFEPVLSEQDGEFDGHLDALSPDLEFQELEGTSLGAAYGFSVHAAGEGMKARWDRYRARGELGPGIWKLLGKTLRFGFGVEAGAELRFLRHFPEKKQALLALPLEPWVLGSVDSILARMRPGDLASIPIRADFLVRAGIKTPVLGVPVKPSLFLRLGGNFQFELLRLREGKVRIRFLSQKSRQVGAAVKAGLGWEAELFELLGKSVRLQVDFDLFKTSWIRKYGDGVLLDATLDLTDPRGRQAFEEVFYRPVALTQSSKKLLNVGFARIQDLSQDPEAEGVVDLHQCGLLRFRQKAWKMKLGSILWRWGRRDLETLVEYEPKDPSQPSMVVASHTSVGKRTFFFRRQGKWYHHSQVFAQKRGGRLELGLWSLGYRVKDRRFSNRDRRDFRRRATRVLGPAHALEILDPPGDAEIPSGKADLKLRFSRAALDQVANMAPETLEAAWEAWLTLQDPGFLWRQSHLFSRGRMTRDLQDILKRALRGDDPEALRDLARFRVSNRAFTDFGPGFLLHLLNPSQESREVSLYARYKDSTGAKDSLTRGELESQPSEVLLPFLYFLATGISELQAAGLEEAIQARIDVVAEATQAELPEDSGASPQAHLGPEDGIPSLPGLSAGTEDFPLDLRGPGASDLPPPTGAFRALWGGVD